MNSTSGAWQLTTGVSRELRVEPGGSTVLYVWLSLSFLLLVVFLILALSFARHTRRVLRRRRVLLDYAEANITTLRPRIHRMFTSRAGSMVTAWPDFTARSGVEADDHRGSTIDQWRSSQSSRCSSPCFSQGSVDRDWSDASRIFWTDWSDCSAHNSDKPETQFGLQHGVLPFSPGGDDGRKMTRDPGLVKRHRATCSHMAFCGHEGFPGGDVMHVLVPSAPFLQELSSTSLSSASHVEDWSRDCSVAATRPLGSTTIARSPNSSVDSSFTANVTPIRPLGTSYDLLERHSSFTANVTPIRPLGTSYDLLERHSSWDADAVSTQRESSLPFHPPFTEIHTASRRPLRLLLPCADASKTADVDRFKSTCNNDGVEGSTSSEARSCGYDVSDVCRTHHHDVSDVYRAHHHDASDVYKTHHHYVSDVYRTHHHDISDVYRTHRQGMSDVYRTHHHGVSDVHRTHHHDVGDVHRTHHHDVGDVFRTLSGCVDVPLTPSSATTCAKRDRRSARGCPVRHDGDCGQKRAAGGDQSAALGLFRKQRTTDLGGRRSGARDDAHSATSLAGRLTLPLVQVFFTTTTVVTCFRILFS